MVRAATASDAQIVALNLTTNEVSSSMDYEKLDAFLIYPSLLIM